jgi:hypothetical protein
MPAGGKGTQGDVPTRWVELIVALLVIAGGVVVVADSLRVGIAWAEDGPKAGYFPFYIGCILALAGAWIAGSALVAWRREGGRTFVSRDELRPVMAMLLPTIGYVALMYIAGIYVASALYIAGFMVWQGKYRWGVALATGVAIPVALFFLFEIWFLVPLPKGPVENLLGY